LIAGASRIVSLLDGVPGGVIPSRPAAPAIQHQRSVWRTLRLTPLRAGIAASLMIAAASVFASRHEKTGMTVHIDTAALPQVAARVAPVVPAPAPVRPPAAKPVSRRVAEVAKDSRSQGAVAEKSVAVATAQPDSQTVRDKVQNSAQAPAASATEPSVAASRSVASADANISAGVSGQRKAMAPMALSQVVTTGLVETRGALSEFCYEIVRDSTVKGDVMAERFALDAGGVVREQRADSMMVRGSWLRGADGTITIRFSGVRPTMVLTNSGQLLNSNGERIAARVTRIACRR
jgi:hypothetical protein